MFDFITIPFSLVLRFLSELFNNYGVALFVFALIVTAIRVPFDIKSKRGMMGTQVLQPKIKAIQEKYAGNQMKINQETQKLYKESGVKPTAGCIWNLFPMIIMIVLIGIIREPLSHIMALSPYQVDALRYVAEGLGYYVGDGAHAQTQLASIMAGPHFAEFQAAVPEIFRLNMNFLGMDMGAIPEPMFWTFTTGAQWGLFFLPILSTGGIYLTQKIMQSTNYMQQAQQAQMMKTMMLLMPLMSLFFGFTFPAAMSIYWLASNLMFTGCSVLINRRFKGVFEAMQAEMAAKDAELEKEREAKRKETARLRALNATQENKGTSKKKKQLAEREKERQRLASQKAALEADEEEYNPSRVDHRKYARGRAYDPERFDRSEDEELPEVDLDADDEDELLDLPESQDEALDDDLDLEEYEDEDDFDEDDDLDEDDDFDEIDEDEDQ